MMCVFSFALYATVFNVVVMRIAKITELYLFHTSSQRLFILRRQAFISPRTDVRVDVSDSGISLCIP
jgi:hypothetical protein